MWGKRLDQSALDEILAKGHVRLVPGKCAARAEDDQRRWPTKTEREAEGFTAEQMTLDASRPGA